MMELSGGQGQKDQVITGALCAGCVTKLQLEKSLRQPSVAHIA